MKVSGFELQGSTVNMALVTATLILAQQIAGKAIRDTLFLSHYPATDLPKAMLLTALLSLLAVLSMTRLMLRHGPARVVPWGFVLSALLFVGEWLFIGRWGSEVAMLIYLHTSVLGAILISGFWSVLNERFDPYTARQTFGSITAAATLGGVLGAVIAQEVADYGRVENLLLVLAAMSGLTLFTLKGIGAGAGQARGQSLHQGLVPGFRVLGQSVYLRWVALLVVLVAVLSTLLDYTVKVEAAARLQGKDELIAFFSRFYAAVGLATFLIQPVLGRRILRRFGLAVSMAVLPLVVLAAAGGAALYTRLWTVVFAKGAEMVLANSFYRSGFELLYTPVPEGDKRAVKMLLDVGAQRLGDAAGSGLVLLLLWFLPVLPVAWVLLPVLLFAALALYAIRQLHQGYVQQLESNLRKGAVTLAADEVIDLTTRQTLAESHVAIDRGSLLDRIEEFQRGRDRDGSGPGELDTTRGGVDLPAPLSPFLRACAVLEGGDGDAIRRLLASGPLDERLVPQVLALLGDGELQEPAMDALQPLATRILGQLSDQLLDSQLADQHRRCLPRLMAAANSQRAVYALMAGLSDACFGVRYVSGRALSRMLARNEGLQLDSSTLLEVVRREVQVTPEEWDGESRRQLLLDAALTETGTRGGGDPLGGSRSLEHVFTLLGLVLEPRVLRLSMHAVRSRDKQMRGTALEYLENVLPEDIRKALWGHLQGN